jgi:hypothetical protein
MKRNIRWTSILSLFALIFLIGSADVQAQKRKPVLKRKVAVKKVVPAIRTYPVATGTVIRARMNKSISSKTARVGETFTVTVTEPVYSTTGVVVVPVGSTIQGRVNSVRAAAKGGRPGEIDASFVRVRLPNGSSRAINGSLTELTSGAESDNEGTATGKRMKNRKVIFIGGGGAGGVLLGGAIGGGKGALIGGLLGAGGGYLGERMTKGPEAEVKTGTEFGIYLNQAISLPRFVEAPDRSL